MKEAGQKKRSLNIDAIRCLALFLVVSVHFFLYTNHYQTPFIASDISSMLLRNFSFICVPLFIITIGYLSMNKVEWNKKYYVNLLRVYILYVICMVLCTIFDPKFSFLFDGIVLVVKNILGFNYYGWYVIMYLGLMFIALTVVFKAAYDEAIERALNKTEGIRHA